MVLPLLEKALRQEFLTAEEGLALFQHAPTSSLVFVGNQLRQKMVPGNKVTWIIDRNSNTTN
ncbi:MAG TPA: dehypoxanthine futalosine cyclase, partial [Saprospiraceae bacterium]